MKGEPIDDCGDSGELLWSLGRKLPGGELVLLS